MTAFCVKLRPGGFRYWPFFADQPPVRLAILGILLRDGFVNDSIFRHYIGMFEHFRLGSCQKYVSKAQDSLAR